VDLYCIGRDHRESSVQAKVAGSHGTLFALWALTG
jgi:hypothetical protein